MLKKTMRILFPILLWAAVVPLTVWADTADIPVSGGHPYKTVRLIPAVYNRANPDLSDLLVQDETGSAVPYFINSAAVSQTSEPTVSHTLTSADAFAKDGDTYADYFIETDENKDIIATSLSIQTTSPLFAKNVELRGGYDGMVWDVIQSDKLYRVDETEKLSIVFERPLKYTHYRLRVLNNMERKQQNDILSIEGMHLVHNASVEGQTFFKESMTPAFAVTQQDRETIIQVQGLKNVKISELTIHTKDSFKRPVRFANGRSKMIYNLPFGDGASQEKIVYHDTTLPFDGHWETDDVLTLTIQNGDDKPLHIDQITLTYLADEIVFKGENGKTYTLFFGDASVTSAPVYDIVHYKDLILEGGYDLLALQNIAAAQPDPAGPKIDYTKVFNILVIAASVLLGGLIIFHLARKNK